MIKEKELKGIISEETYKELLAKVGKRKTSVNFYYSNDQLIIEQKLQYE